MQKIISYNVNGIRSAWNKGFAEWIEKENPDVLCLQELKAHEDQIDLLFFQSLGYHILLNPAQKKGYSGVALFSKRKPDFHSQGIGIQQFDVEGRLIRADFGPLTILCVYIPSGTMGELRQGFKMEFLNAFSLFINNLRKERPELLICGDFNIAHKSIDINHPERHKKSSGFVPEERKWLDELFASGFVDTFREFDASPEKYSWWSYLANSRTKNLGWRIDYHVVTEQVRPKLKNAGILSEVVHSDHCPVMAEVDY
ncbi:MAG: exodeoxyribonuclease III [Bacteroidales bacterium]|jgi:exodeoxyribonuclease-3|nr:exodeoxyribonuclease III [Bacteroidales bacterium]